MISKQTIFQASTIIVLATLVGRGLGFVREMVIAYSFGVQFSYDIYLVAITFPAIINTIMMFSIPGAFIPLYLKTKLSGSKLKTDTFTWNILTTHGIIFILIAVLLIVFAPIIVSFYSPSLSQSQLDEAKSVFRFVSIIVVFGGIFAILKSVLNANKHFLYPALSPLLLNVMIIICVFSLSDFIATKALAIGLVAGYFIQFLFLIWVYFRNYYFGKPLINLSDTLLKKMFSVLGIIIAIETIGHLSLVIDRSFISFLPEGSISALNYATNLYQIPISVFGVALGTAIFPSISEFIIAKKWNDLTNLFSKSVCHVIVVTVPIVFSIMLFADELVTLIFQRGAFDRYATDLTAQALQYLSIGLIAFVCHAVIVKIFYALHYSRILLLSILIAFIIKITLSIWLVQFLFHRGLALATAVSGIFNFIFLIFFLRKKMKRIHGKKIVVTFLKVSVISIVSVVFAKLIMNILSEISLIYRMLISLFCGIIIYLGLAYFIKLEEVKYFFKKFLN